HQFRPGISDQIAPETTGTATSAPCDLADVTSRRQVLNRPPAVIWLQGREVGAEHGQPDPGDHPGRAEGRPVRLEGMPEREPWIVHAAGVTPPAPERLRQPGLPVGCQKPARPGSCSDVPVEVPEAGLWL